MGSTTLTERAHRAYAREVLRQMREDFTLSVLDQTHFLPGDAVIPESQMWAWIARWLDEHGFLDMEPA